MPEDRSERAQTEVRLGQSARGGGATADRVAGIIEAAEATAEQLTQATEERVRARIAEGDRAARFRIEAAEAEAAELIEQARSEAARVGREGRERDEAAKTTATSEALQILAGAQENADATIAEAADAAAHARAEAQRSSRELLAAARAAADAVHGEGTELSGNLRAMGDSLRANAERLLRDVQALHSQMMARIEIVEATRQAHADAVDDGRAERAPRDHGDDDVPDVPEFIPRR